jgi:phage shock protein A
MGLFDRIGRVLRSNITATVNAAEDPEKILDQTIVDMQENLVKLKQAVAVAMASKKRLELQYTQTENQANEWYQRAQLALKKGNEELARDALARKQTVASTAATLKKQLEESALQEGTLKRNLKSLESQFNEAKTNKNMLQARARAAEATEKISEAMGQINTSDALSTFDRMEEKILEKEARSSALAELAGDSLEQQFISLGAGDDVELELQALKESLQTPMIEAQIEPKAIEGKSQNQGALPAADKAQSNIPTGVVEAELEAMRIQMKQPPA